MANYDLVTIMDNMIQNLDYEASLAGVSLESLLCLGASSSEVYDLWAGTEYSVVAWGMDGGGTRQPILRWRLRLKRKQMK